MAKQHPRDFSGRQWLSIVLPTPAASMAAWLGRNEMEFPMPLYFVGAGLALSLLLFFVMVYGEDL